MGLRGSHSGIGRRRGGARRSQRSLLSGSLPAWGRRGRHKPAECGLRVRARAYDLVLNGTELGSGSIRIHDPEMQQQVFSGLGMTRDDAERRFGFLLNAFRYGAPPHGGFAYGLDRVVMLAAGEETIREVIAFPKNQQAEEPMTDAPAPADPKQLRELGLELVRPTLKQSR